MMRTIREPLATRRIIAACSLCAGALVGIRTQTDQPASTAPTVKTITLPAPEGDKAANEPAVAIDPNNPSHIAVSAMYPSPAGGGSRRLWLWRSTDGGRSWHGERVLADTLPGDPDTAADPVLGFAPDGSVLMGSMAMGEPFGREILARPTPLAGGLYLSRWNPGGPGGGRAQLIAPNSWDSVARVRVGVDKPAMALDRGSASPYRNSIYLGWSNLHMVGTPDTLATRGMLATSRDGGRTFTAPRAIADSAFGMAIATGPAGTLDIAYTNMTGREATGHFLHAIRSTDGGQSFGPPVLIARQQGDSVIELPTAAASSDGDVLACWTEGPRGNVRLTRIRCSTRRGEVWAQPIDVGGPDFTGAVAGWPALVTTAKGWALLLYLSRTTETEVAVFRTTDGRRFTKLATLARARELGSGRFCVRVNGVCPPNALKIGHYVSLARSGDRLVAAFILPRPGKYDGSGGVVVSLIDDPSASTLGTR